MVEVDETLVGGKKRGAGRGYRGNKVWVAGAIQRQGAVRLKQLPNVRRATLHAFIRAVVSDEADAIYTDELASYLGLRDKHKSVNHSIDEWVVGDVHTNSIEGVWALFKRSLMGAFHKVSVKHIDRYLEELEWRHDNRDNDHIFVDTLRRMVKTKHLRYDELTA